MLHFRDAQALHVPRTRYTPIHSLADLALLRSDNFTIRDGALLPNASRLASSLPSVKLDNIHTVRDACARIIAVADSPASRRQT